MTSAKHEPDFGVPKEKLDPEWVEARTKMENEVFGSRFYVKKWYFQILVLAALLMLAASFIWRSLLLAIGAGALTALVYTWNKRAYREFKGDDGIVDVQPLEPEGGKSET